MKNPILTDAGTETADSCTKLSESTLGRNTLDGEKPTACHAVTDMTSTRTLSDSMPPPLRTPRTGAAES